MNSLTQTVENFVNLLDYDNNIIFNLSQREVTEAIISGDEKRVRNIDGQFAIVEKRGQQVFMARSLGRPMRYFLAKQVAGPLLIVAERMDEIYDFLKTKNLHSVCSSGAAERVSLHIHG